MSLLGKAVVAIWNDILPEGRDNFIEWHNREHIPERVSIPGFLRGRRYIAEQGVPRISRSMRQRMRRCWSASPISTG